ncbi:hypothetical protein BX666DRAFT_1909399 [Dichotomocladium elegans]|nr:hypothetical protein BX666DRAFT_1909399 [Dichotomocladium elegans]
MQLKQRNFIVSGGASGLGRQVVESIVAQGGCATILDLNATGSQELVDMYGNENVFFPGSVDVTDETQVKEAIEASVAHFDQAPIGGAVLCSGIVFPPKRFSGYGPNNALTSYQQFKFVMDVNLLGTYCVAQHVAEHLIQVEPSDDDGERGVIITISSMLGLDGTLVSYGTSKAGVAGLTLPLAKELASFGVRVMSVAPGPFATPLALANGAQPPPNCLFPKRLGDPKEFSNLILHVIENPMLNGSVIRLDGGTRG